jgi:hypothetical protein
VPKLLRKDACNMKDVSNYILHRAARNIVLPH